MKKNRGKKSTTHHALSNDIKRSGAPDADYKTYKAATRAKAKLSGVFFSLARCNVACACRYCGGQPLSQIVVAIPSAIVIGYAISALEAGAMTSGDVAAFLGVMLLMHARCAPSPAAWLFFRRCKWRRERFLAFWTPRRKPTMEKALSTAVAAKSVLTVYTMRYATTKKSGADGCIFNHSTRRDGGFSRKIRRR